MENKSEVVEEVGVADATPVPETQTVAPTGVEEIAAQELPSSSDAMVRAVELISAPGSRGFVSVVVSESGQVECTIALSHEDAIQCVSTAVCALGHLTKEARKDAESTGRVPANPEFYNAPDFNVGMSTIVSTRVMFEATRINNQIAADAAAQAPEPLSEADLPTADPTSPTQH